MTIGYLQFNSSGHRLSSSSLTLFFLNEPEMSTLSVSGKVKKNGQSSQNSAMVNLIYKKNSENSVDKSQDYFD